MNSPAPLEASVQAVRRLGEVGHDYLLVDCREPEEHAIAALAGARLIPMGQLPDRLVELAGHEASPVIVYCHHGGRSLQVARWLRQVGFEHAQSMAGGIDRWAIEIEPGMARY